MQSIKNLLPDVTKKLTAVDGGLLGSVENEKNGRVAIPQPPPKALSDFVLDHLSTAVSVTLPNGKPKTYSETALLETALHGAGEWLKAHKQRPGLSFVLVSGGLPAAAQVVDHKKRPLSADLFDGYGSGKTTIAEILYNTCQTVFIEEDTIAHAIQKIAQAPNNDPGLMHLATKTQTTIEQARQSLIEAYQLRRDNDPPRQQSVHLGKFFTSAGLMEALAGGRDDMGNGFSERVGVIVGETSEVVVIDDIGREGQLPYIGRDVQTAEIQNRYYRVIDYCYRLFKNGKRSPSLVITSNMRLHELKAFLGGASWSRLEEMCPVGAGQPGFMHDITGVRNWRKLPRHGGVL